MHQPDPPQLDSLVETNREAFEDALNDMVESGFGELEDRGLDRIPMPVTPRDLQALTFFGY
jgi:hypothetical protein